MDKVHQRASLAVLHHHVVVPFVVVDFMQLYDVRVVELTQEVELGQEERFLTLTALHLAFEYLNGPFLARLLANDAKYLSEASFADAFLKIVEFLDIFSSFPDEVGEIDVQFFEELPPIDIFLMDFDPAFLLLLNPEVNLILDKH